MWGYLLKGFRFIVVLGVLALSTAQVSACPGDFDGNGRVDIADFLALAGAFGARSGDAKYNAVVDMDGSGAIDISDFLAFAGVFGTTCEDPSAGSVSGDRKALVALYNATDGPNWVNNENWLTDAPLGDWYGVDTNESGRVVRLLLSENRLIGTIPPDLGNLANLTDLFLGLNLLWGAIPPELGGLAFLRNLYLGHNDLSGEIPSELAELVRLQRLNLRKNQLTGGIPPELGNLRELGNLDLYSNQLTGEIPAELGNLSKLQVLSLTVNEMTGRIPVELSNLTELRDLSLGSNDLTGPIPPELGSLANLTNLSLSDNDLTGPIPPELGSLSNLTGLSLGGNRLTGAIPHNFLQLNGLQTLGCAQSDGVCLPATAAFREWEQQIEARSTGSFHVDVPWCDEVDRRVLEELYNAAGGREWTRTDGWLEDEDLADWHGVAIDSVAGRVSGLDLTGNGLSGHLPAVLGQLVGLKELRIGDNALSGRLPLSIAALPLEAFDYGSTGLCTVDDASFEAWLNGIPQHIGTGVACPPLTDREILELLYLNTGGSSWTESRGWLSNAPLSEWQGVETESDGRVVGLALRRNRLSGSVPSELGDLSTLRKLDLGGNEISGPIPPELGNLDYLRELRLGDNRLSGEIPRILGGLDSLVRLDLSRNRLSGQIPVELGHLGNLVVLVLHSNSLSGPIPSALGGLDSLQNLNLAGNRLIGEIPEELGQLGNLVWLSLDSNSLSGPIPSALGGLDNLVRLDLSGNRLTGDIPGELAQLGALEYMVLDDNQLTGRVPPQFGELATLSELDLSNNELTGPIPPELGVLPSLTTLDLGENQFSGPLPAELADAANLQRLDLRSNALSGPVPSEFAGLKLLKSLILANNPGLAGPLPAGITALDQLEQFMAGGTGLCRPPDAVFDAWFGTIADRLLARCPDGSAAYLTQTVQSRDYPVPLLAGEPALLRVFVTVSEDATVSIPDIRATFYVDGAEQHSVLIPASTQAIPSEVVESDLARSANAEIPADFIVPGLEMVIEVDPDSALDPALGIRKRIPEAGRMAVDVRAVPEFELTLIPFLWEGYADSTAAQAVDEMAEDASGGHESFRELRTLLPIAGLAVTAHAPVSMSHSNPWELLAQIEAMRLMEGGSGYWIGVVERRPGATFFWRPGMARIGGWVSYARPHDASTMAHELGHNLGLSHAPCGGAGGTDPWFPSATGRIGAWGFDFGQNTLVPPVTPDLMSYCGPPDWISDYHFNKSLDHRLAEVSTELAAVASTRTLLLWGGRDTDGVAYLDPAFVVDAVPALPPAGTEYAIVGADADGVPLFSYPFDMSVTADAEGEETSFVFALPVQREWAGNLVSITLSGPGGSATLDESTDRPMAILRDPKTRQVRGFLSDLPAGESAQAAAKHAMVADPELEVLFSRGIPDLR